MPLEDIRSERVRKLDILRDSGTDPYPASTPRANLTGDILKKFSGLVKAGKQVSIAGRVVAKRGHGGATFLDVRDGTGKIQVYLKKDTLGDDRYNFSINVLDVGDYLYVKGRVFLTKKGEETIEVLEWRMLAKALRPLPEKWHGLQDVEERFRKRYLDLLMNDGVRTRFEMRSQIIQAVREFHEKERFLEVETPIFHPLPGGALAKPFKTHHQALELDLYLRIAKELYLKRLLVGGLDRVFEIGKDFRNEGIDATHNPEFTMLESYAAYWDEENMMKFVENLFRRLEKKFVKDGLIFEEKDIRFGKKFSRVAFKDLLSRYALIPDYDHESRDSLALRARQLGVETGKHETKGKIADEIYKKICRPYLVQPTFVVNHPLDISPLAKRRVERPDEVRRFQLIVASMEIANGFAELNDPLDQRRRFAEQEKNRGEGEEEAHRVDEDFIEALEYGMPPSAGLGIGIDRLVMLFTGVKNIREIVFFPTLRPKNN